jgi:transglutaminase-like putative cysteine protease
MGQRICLMLIQAGYHFCFDVRAARAPMILRVLPASEFSVVAGGQLEFRPDVETNSFVDEHGSRSVRLFASPGALDIEYDATFSVSDEPDPVVPGAVQHAVEELPENVLRYLLASRYCEVDSPLNDFAWRSFMGVPAGWARVQAVCDFVHRHLRFDYATARATRTATEAFVEKVGVCRDFTHLAITLCRCLNLPARYAAGFLGDIRIPPLPSPMDFSAWFEVYLSGKWYAFDARFNQPRIGRIVLARGRDASDTAFATIFGRTALEHFEVWTDEVEAPSPGRLVKSFAASGNGQRPEGVPVSVS